MKKQLNMSFWIIGALFALIIGLIQACQKENYRTTTTDEVNITGYLEQHADDYSLLTDIMYRSKTAGYLGAYGTYTLFAPNNASITTWMKDNGKSALTDFTDAELLDFIKYHVVRDTVGTLRFSDGKIKTPSLFGEYLYTDVLRGNYRINKSAMVTKSNIFCGNGIIHAIDKVLTPPVQSIAEMVANNPRYRIFSAALKETGFYDTLYYKRGMEIAANKRFQTLIVESDSALNTLGIHDISDLKAKYSQTGNPKNPKDSLWLYMAYHITNDAKFLEDVVAGGTLYTLAPKEIITTKLFSTSVLLNEGTFNGIFEPGAELNRTYSDLMASNGVIHESKQEVKIKVRPQVPVYFDIATSPELLSSLGSAYQSTAKPLVANGQSIANSIGFNNLTVLTIGTNAYTYYKALESKRPYANGDLLSLSLCFNNANRAKWIEFKTPYLVKGRYKVWICYAQHGDAPEIQATFNPGKADEQILPNIIVLNQTLTASGVSDLGNSNADNLMLAQGYKRYMATVGDYNANNVTGGLKAKTGSEASLNVGRLAGIINVETTDRHVIRFEAVKDKKCGSNTVYLDMIQFIPADDLEQNYPRFHQLTGELFYRPQQ
ncbi:MULTISPECIES: fasciclin domain-containing protein [Sphingobacterium]|uniref:fasciclin domain-containing protein n=1 Tax=Sphingobacterium TaxID=28453 RepID=UPI00257C891E|nr:MULTISPECIES: fasciclin domain-containing protein [Sphingobacterium]